MNTTKLIENCFIFTSLAFSTNMSQIQAYKIYKWSFMSILISKLKSIDYEN